MTHSLTKSNGTVINLTSGQVDKLDKLSQAKFRALVDYYKFVESDLPKVMDLTEPSNTTLAYLSMILAECTYWDENTNIYKVDPTKVNRALLAIDGISLNGYISAADQILERVSPDSPSFTYSKEAGVVARPGAQQDFFKRLQIIMEPILYKQFNSRPLDVVVDQEFDVPYVLNLYARVSVWTPEQYLAYDNLKKEDDKAKAES